MQPPPQAGPPGAGAPPPRMGMTTTPYWRKRTPTPSAMAPPLVQPVTDPFAFGRMTPQNIPPSNIPPSNIPPSNIPPSNIPPSNIPPSSIPPSNAPQANVFTTQSSSPLMYPQPFGSSGDRAQVSLPGSSSQPMAADPSFNYVSAPSVQGGHFTNNMTSTPIGHPAAPSPQNVAGGLENMSGPGRSQSRQSVNMEMNNNSRSAPLLQPYPPATSQQTTAPWSSLQAAPPTSTQHVPAAQHPAYTAPYYSPPYLEVSPPQTNEPGYFSAPQRTPPVTFPLGGGSGHVQQHGVTPYSNVMPADYPQNQNPEHWFNQSYPEPPKQGPPPNLNTLHTGAPYHMPETRPQSEPARPRDQAPSDPDSGTVSMFFKGDEAENVEIPSTDQQHVPRRQSVDTAYHQNLGRPGNVHPFTAPPRASPHVPSPLPLHPSAPSAHPNTQPSPSPQSASAFQDPHVPWKNENTENHPAEAKAAPELPYDNVENIEVLPNEPPNNSLFSAGVTPEVFRYAPVLGSTLPKNPVSHPEGGPNLEAPDALHRPVRSDSVSSNYSNLSHQSLPVPARPQELEGTFIQKEIGRPDNENSSSFFKQIDSSPLAGDVTAHGMTPNPYYGNLSQPPTPSPPKPTGIFQASVNSSFEPVRSHASVKPPEMDQSKVVSDIRENHKLPPTSSSHNAGLAASPGNLEQPPDNLETIFLGKPNAEICAVNSGHHFTGGSALDNISLLLERRPSSRAHGSNKKCESPATTLWAQGELPNFGGNVLLAPPAPAVYVPPKPQTEVIQPPEDSSVEAQHGRKDQGQFSASPEEPVSSENLENPPKMAEDEQTQSQASSGYASLLSSPPTETLHNQPVLIAPPSKAYNLAQPVNFSLSLPNQIKNLNSAKDFSSASDKPLPSGGFQADISSSASLGPPHKPLPASNLANKSAGGIELFSESFSNHQNALVSSHQIPLNLVTENQKTTKTESPAGESMGRPAPPGSAGNLPMGNGAGMYAPPLSTAATKPENAGALDFTVPRVPASHNTNGRVPVQNRPPGGAPPYTNQVAGLPNFQPGPDNNKQVFYQQVTKDAQSQPSVETSQPGLGAPHEYMTPASQPPAPPVQTSKPTAYPQQTGDPVPAAQNSASLHYGGITEPGAKYGHPEHPPYPGQPVTAPSAPVNPIPPAGYPDPPRPPASQTPQQADPYYYYRGYGAYPSAYQQPYPAVDPRAPHLYYQDPYGAYDPAYRQYSNPAFVNPTKYQEPERPSSRSSHCSDRPSSRQGYTAPGSYYDYYQSQYEYGDPSRWDRYPGAYDPGYRDPQSSYWNYMYGSREDAYGRKVPYAYTSRYNVYEDRWQYDPRYVGGFDDEPDARRDLVKDDFDRRSVHSEHSARSVHSERSSHSRRSSFSSRSQQSQVYKSEQDLTANAYGAQVPNPPLQDYSYSMYPNDYSTQQSLDSYQYGYAGSNDWQPVEQVPSRSLTPEKFASPHVCARFGPGGHLIKVLPNLPSDGQPTLVEIHNMEVILQNSPEQEQLRAFPGPLVKDETHKVDVINFAQNKAKECSQNESLLDQESARLLWDFIVLMCRQNGTVVGTDIAELLLQDHKTVWLPGKSPNEANLIDFNEPLEHEEESGASQLSFLTDTLPNAGLVLEKETERFRELLLFGRKKDALESAMKHGLWGHALLLASKMDSRTHARVMTRFANSLPINDPLQTVYQLLSGRMPAAATCCGDEKWGDWRPHLAMVLSNLTNNVDVPTRTIVTMGDTLASRGLLEAAHFCYLMAQVGFGVFTKKSTKVVLIGSNHSLPFAKFATNEAIQRTEAYEYAQSLGAQTISLPNIQVFKFIYACRLAEYGLSAQAFHYCEVISKTIIKHPSYYSPVLVGQLLEVSSHLRFFDPQLKEKPEQELFVEPPWLLHLRHVDMQMKQGTVVYNTGRTTPQQYACSTPSSEHDQVSHSDGITAAHEAPAATDNPLLTNFLPSVVSAPGVQLALPGPDNTAAFYPPPPVSEPPSSVPPQTYVPSPMLAPPLPGQGFVPVSSEQVPTYPPAPMESAQSAPPAESMEQWSPDPALQRPPTNSPTKTTFHDTGFDFYGEMAKMAPGQRSRTVSQSSSHMRRTRTTSESSTHSIGSTRRSSVGMQPSPPPIPEVKKTEPKKEPKSNAAHGSGRSWFGWLMRKGKNEAHLPDDRNKSIVWDETRQRWINQDEPEGEDNKPLPPPPSIMPKRPLAAPAGPGAPGAPPNPSVNAFSIKAGGGVRPRYVDVLNPGGNKPTNSVPPPADLFAPLAPMPILTNLFVPNAVPEESQPPVGSEAEMAQPSEQPSMDSTAQTQFFSAAPGQDLPAPNHEDYPSGELSRCSSQSSLSREVSQHFHQAPGNMAPAGGPPPPPAAAVPFYNPASFAQPPASSGLARSGRLGQRKYPTLK